MRFGGEGLVRVCGMAPGEVSLQDSTASCAPLSKHCNTLDDASVNCNDSACRGSARGPTAVPAQHANPLAHPHAAHCAASPTHGGMLSPLFSLSRTRACRPVYFHHVSRLQVPQSVPLCNTQLRQCFGALAIKPGGIHLVVGAEAQAAGSSGSSGAAALSAVAAGSAFIEFASPSEALKALVRLQVHLNSGLEKLRKCSRIERLAAVIMPWQHCPSALQWMWQTLSSMLPAQPLQYPCLSTCASAMAIAGGASAGAGSCCRRSVAVAAAGDAQRAAPRPHRARDPGVFPCSWRPGLLVQTSLLRRRPHRAHQEGGGPGVPPPS